MQFIARSSSQEHSGITTEHSKVDWRLWLAESRNQSTYPSNLANGANRPPMRWILRHSRSVLLTLGYLTAVAVHAQDATWILNPGSGTWNTATNWTPQKVPEGTATFGSSSTTSITFSKVAPVGTIQFNAGAPAYSFDVSGETLFLSGTGIVNNSSNAPTFSATSGGLEFTNTSTAGNAFLIATAGGTHGLLP
jgi:hypothetical protein